MLMLEKLIMKLLNNPSAGSAKLKIIIKKTKETVVCPNTSGQNCCSLIVFVTVSGSQFDSLSLSVCGGLSDRLSLPWLSWWRSVGTRILQPGWQLCALRRLWIRSTSLWRRVKSHESSSWGSSPVSGAGVGSGEGLRNYYKGPSAEQAEDTSPSVIQLRSPCGVGHLPLTSYPSVWLIQSPHIFIWAGGFHQATQTCGCCVHTDVIWTVTQSQHHGLLMVLLHPNTLAWARSVFMVILATPHEQKYKVTSNKLRHVND